MSFPGMQSAMSGMTEHVQFAVVDKGSENFQLVETINQIFDIDMVLAPMPPQRLLIKPEGERDWKYLVGYSRHRLELDWILADRDGKQYRILSRQEWPGAGTYDYELTEMPQAGS